MSWHDVRILYLRELRSALRERGVVVNSLLLPVLLYPLLLWVAFNAIAFVSGQEERFVSRVALSGCPPAHAEWCDGLGDDERLELRQPPAPPPSEQVEAGEIDAIAELLPAADQAAALDGNFRLRLTYDASKDRSDKARARLRTALAGYRHRWVRREAEALGVGAEDWEQFRVERRNVASGRQVGAFVLGLLAPFLVVIMVANGCFYPAVDATAGEHERGTWETLISVAASRSSIVAAKYLYVATMGAVAGLLNLTAITVSMGTILAPVVGELGGELSFGIPVEALPVMAVAVALLALFIAAGMMILAAFARTFKEGQSMVGPFYMLVMLPSLPALARDLELNLKFALIPIANVTLLLREAIAGTFNWPLIGLTLAVEVVTVAACLWLARMVLGFEDFLIGSYSGSVGRFLKQRVLARQGREHHAAGEMR